MDIVVGDTGDRNGHNADNGNGYSGNGHNGNGHNGNGHNGNGHNGNGHNGNGHNGNGHNGNGSHHRHVLVIGGAGFLGSVLVRDLLDRGHSVTVMDSLMYGDDGIRDLYEVPQFTLIQGDLRNVEAIVRAARNADAVVHLGALVGDPVCDLDEETTLAVNLEATRTVTGVARGLGIERLVFASTCSVYGESEGWVDETSTLEPVSLYARTKADSERFLLDAPLGDFTPVVLRFGTLYGASPRVRFDLVVNLLLAKALSEGEITIFGGTQWRPLIDVADGARAIVSCLEAPADLVRGQVFNVGADDQNYTMADIGRAIADLVPGTHLVLEVEREREASYRVSSAKIHEMLGFVPTYSLRDGLLDLKAAIEGDLAGRYADDRFSNVKALSAAREALAG